MIFLNQDERDKFACWCEQQANSCNQIIEQLEKLGPHFEIIGKREKQFAVSALIVAQKLRATEEVSVGS